MTRLLLIFSVLGCFISLPAAGHRVPAGRGSGDQTLRASASATTLMSVQAKRALLDGGGHPLAPATSRLDALFPMRGRGAARSAAAASGGAGKGSAVSAGGSEASEVVSAITDRRSHSPAHSRPSPVPSVGSSTSRGARGGSHSPAAVRPGGRGAAYAAAAAASGGSGTGAAEVRLEALSGVSITDPGGTASAGRTAPPDEATEIDDDISTGRESSTSSSDFFEAHSEVQRVVNWSGLASGDDKSFWSFLFNKYLLPAGALGSLHRVLYMKNFPDRGMTLYFVVEDAAERRKVVVTGIVVRGSNEQFTTYYTHGRRIIPGAELPTAEGKAMPPLFIERCFWDRISRGWKGIEISSPAMGDAERFAGGLVPEHNLFRALLGGLPEDLRGLMSGS